MQRIYKLKGVIQPYAWGGTEFIPSLTGIRHSGPAAEYWLGAHPLAPSLTEDGKRLDELIRENKQDFLGEFCPEYDSLPFLMKVLDVKDMLSIQVHPDEYEARIGFERENRAGVPLTAPHRNYKDPNRKTEVMVALSEFWLLRGFRAADELGSVFAIPEFSILEKYFAEGGYEKLFQTVMRMEQSAVNEMLKPLAERVTILYNKGELSKDDPDFWAARALQTYFDEENIDRGIFSIYLLNLLHLKKGQVVDQWPGVLHAYLEGQNIEVMSNSDNVLRAGLTNKHIDVEELLRLTSFEHVPRDVPEADGNLCYSAAEFLLCHNPHPYQGEIPMPTPAIFLVTSGSMSLTFADEKASISKGDAVYVLPGSEALVSSSQDVEFFMVSVPKKEP